jgi:spore coat polysaccharide biosynthesis protein SpsF (cytidylyltransferase family)
VIAVVQARMGSQRLPGKVLTPIAGTTLLGLLLDRLARCEAVASIAVATSSEAADDAVAAYCRERGTTVVRGPLDDVAARFLAAGERLGAEAVVRISGDSPLMDPALIDRAARLFDDACDVVTNVRPRTFPPGQSVEVVRVSALAAVHPRMGDDDREHVTPLLYRPEERMRLRAFTADRDYEGLRLTVDTPQDLAFVRALVRRMTRPQHEYGLDEIADLAGAV